MNSVLEQVYTKDAEFIEIEGRKVAKSFGEKGL